MRNDQKPEVTTREELGSSHASSPIDESCEQLDVLGDPAGWVEVGPGPDGQTPARRNVVRV